MMKTKHAQKVQDEKNSTQYNNLKSPILSHIRDDYYDQAQEYWQETKDINGYLCMLKGC